METADEICLFVKRVLMKDPDISIIPIEISKEVWNRLVDTTTDFRSHVLQVFQDHIKVHKVQKNMKIDFKGSPFVINDDIYNNSRFADNTPFNGIRISTSFEILEWNGKGRLIYRNVMGKINKIQEWYPNGIPGFVYFEKHGKNEGKYSCWFMNGQKDTECFYKNGLLDGPFEKWWENGKRNTSTFYKNGEKDGKYDYWYKNGVKGTSCTFLKGKLEGISRQWNFVGGLMEEALYHQGSRV